MLARAVATWFSLGILLLGGPLGCREKEEAEPRAPWRAGTKGEEKPEIPHLVRRYSLEAQSKLDFEVPGKKISAKGMLTNLQGEIETDLLELEQTHGTITIPLSELSLFGETGTPDTERTIIAKRWLGLGALASEREWREAKNAEFRVTSLKDVRPHRAMNGSVIPGSTDSARRVRAVARGRLSIRSLSVDAEWPIELDFFFKEAPKTTSEAESISVRLGSGIQVSLEEHEIAARDERGKRLPPEEGSGALHFGKMADVSGVLGFLLISPPPAPSPSEEEQR